MLQFFLISIQENTERLLNMKTFIALFLILAAIIVVGKIEDPCTTEGLAPGCIETNSNSQ